MVQHVAPAADFTACAGHSAVKTVEQHGEGHQGGSAEQHQGALLVVGGRGHEVGAADARREGGPRQRINGNAVKPTDERRKRSLPTAAKLFQGHDTLGQGAT